MVVVGVLSSASTSLTPFFFPPLLPFLSLSLFLSFSLFSLFLSSDLGTQFLLISWISLANSVPTDISSESSDLVDLHFGLPDTRGCTLLRPVRLLVGLRVGLVDGACPVVMAEPFVPPITHETALRVSSYELPKGQRRVPNAAGVLLLLLLPTLLQGLPAFPVAPRVQVVGHEGTNGHLGGLIVVVIIVESLTTIGSRWVHGSFPARPLANVVDVTVAGPQPAGVVEVPVLLEYFLSNPLEDLVATHPRRDGLQTDGLAANSHSSTRHIAVFSRSPVTVMRRAFRRECRLTSRATFFLAQATAFI